ncbi:hypothetical protein GCM10022287_03880 [Gryllotalpicola koreensis]|uniref:Uncharacterized protein n=1 Tax=Gryllotalpicola koreensis TaxID=993086 RepID=A0ABP7ZRF0_9MICO
MIDRVEPVAGEAVLVVVEAEQRDVADALKGHGHVLAFLAVLVDVLSPRYGASVGGLCETRSDKRVVDICSYFRLLILALRD